MAKTFHDQRGIRDEIFGFLAAKVLVLGIDPLQNLAFPKYLFTDTNPPAD
jgi:hypothetical protein